jgi:mitotic spindle assembly checkpoint protein MAD2
VSKLVLVIAAIDTQEVLERWSFNVDTDQEVVNENTTSDKDPKEIQKEIAAIIRQITASVTFLPLLEVPCSFDLLMYTKLDTQVPTDWELSDPKYIARNNEVRLRSFTTKIHKVDTAVSYRVDE